MSADTARTTIVLLHAFPLNSRMFAPQLEALGRDYLVVAPDFPGFGEQPGLDQESLTMERAALFVGRELESRGVGRCVLGGLSMGGYVALECWRAFPEKICGLVLADTRAEADSPEALQGRYDAMERIGAGRYAEYAETLLRKLLCETTRSERPDVVADVLDMMMEVHPQYATAAILGMAERRDCSDLLPSITVPTAVIVGEHDAVTPPSAAEALARAIPDAALTVIPRAGHISNLENAAAFNGAI